MQVEYASPDLQHAFRFFCYSGGYGIMSRVVFLMDQLDATIWIFMARQCCPHLLSLRSGLCDTPGGVLAARNIVLERKDILRHGHIH